MSATVHSGLLPAAHRGFANHRRKNACGSLKGAWMPSGTKQITCYVEWTCTDHRWGNGRRLGTATEHASLSATMTWHCYRTCPCASVLSILMWSCPETGQQTEQPKCQRLSIIETPCEIPIHYKEAKTTPEKEWHAIKRRNCATTTNHRHLRLRLRRMSHHATTHERTRHYPEYSQWRYFSTSNKHTNPQQSETTRNRVQFQQWRRTQISNCRCQSASLPTKRSWICRTKLGRTKTVLRQQGRHPYGAWNWQEKKEQTHRR